MEYIWRDISNSGSITGTGSDTDYGIVLWRNSVIKRDINNSGSIISGGAGIYLDKSIIERCISNSGSITGTGGGYGYGICLGNNSIIKGDINNLGIIFGTTNAVKNDSRTTTLVNNYGVLATKGESAISDSDVTSTNYGIYIEDGKVSIDSTQNLTDPITMGIDENGNEIKRTMTIKNAVIEAGGISTKSFTFTTAGENYDNSILNGKDKTLIVSGTDNEINGSVINAYGTAVEFAAAGGDLTLSGTIVNGEIDNTVTESGNGNTLILQSGTVIYTDNNTGTQNTIINGNINMGAKNDILTVRKGTIINGNINMGNNDDNLTIETGSIINGTLDGGDGDDTLNFNSPVTRTSDNDEINILHNISDFENMNINTNVTLFETTVDSNGNSTGLKVTDAENITLGAGGVLTLRIDSANKTDNKIVGHALYGNNGVVSSTDGGKLLLALNGAGNDSIISFGGTKLDSSLVTGNEVASKEDITFDTTSKFHTLEKLNANEVKVAVRWNIPEILKYEHLNKIYHGILSVDGLENFNVDNNEKLSLFLGYLNDIYAGNPYSYSSELSRKSMGMFRDIVTENIFRPETNKWMIYGGLTHIDGGT
ncbi:MAG: autotransporter domain-containing protein, partial [Fusobacterium sp.]|nr:autotransporter domain-containing protein [Fusobacterium sp.]